MLKMPDDSVAKEQSQLLEDVVVKNVERENLAILHKVANLPTDTSIFAQDAIEFGNDLRLRFQISFNWIELNIASRYAL